MGPGAETEEERGGPPPPPPPVLATHRTGWRSPRSRALIGLLVALFVGFKALADMRADDDHADQVREDHQISPGGIATTTPPPTSTTAPTTPPPAAPLPTIPALPGLTGPEVVEGLAGPGWTCTEETGMYPDHVQHTCHDAVDRAWLDLVARPEGEVLVVTVYGYEDALGAFEEVASLGWTGVDGGEVMAWIGSTVTTTTVVGAHDRLFGDVPFTLVGDPGSVAGDWALEIGRPVT